MIEINPEVTRTRLPAETHDLELALHHYAAGQDITVYKSVYEALRRICQAKPKDELWFHGRRIVCGQSRIKRSMKRPPESLFDLPGVA